MGTDAPLTNAFNEWNRLLIDQQQWDVKKELAKEDQAMQNVMLEEKIKDMQLNRENVRLGMQATKMNNELTKMKLEEEQEWHSPKALNLWDVAPVQMSQNPEFMKDVKSFFGQYDNIDISVADGRLMNGDEELQFTGPQMQNIIIGLDGVYQKHSDTPNEVGFKIPMLTAQLKETQKEYDALRKRGAVNADPRQLTELQNQLVGMKSALGNMAHMTSNEGRAEYWMRKRDHFRSIRGLAMRNGQEQLAKYFDDSAEEANVNASRFTKMLDDEAMIKIRERIEHGNIRLRHNLGMAKQRDDQDFRTSEREASEQTSREMRGVPQAQVGKVYNTDFESDHYGSAVRDVTLDGSGETALGPNESLTKPTDWQQKAWAAKKGRIAPTEKDQKGQFTEKQALDSIHRRYKGEYDEKTGIFSFTDASNTRKANTIETLAVEGMRMNFNVGGKPVEGRGNKANLVYNTVDRAEREYHRRVEPLKDETKSVYQMMDGWTRDMEISLNPPPKPDKSLGEDAQKEYQKMLKEYLPKAQKMKEVGMFLEMGGYPGVNSIEEVNANNYKEVMMALEEFRFKSTVYGQFTNMGFTSIASPDDIYTPDDNTAKYVTR